MEKVMLRKVRFLTFRIRGKQKTPDITGYYMLSCRLLVAFTGPRWRGVGWGWLGRFHIKVFFRGKTVGSNDHR